MKKIIDDSEDVITIDELHKRIYTEALRRSNGHREKAREIIGISERTFYRKIKEYKLQDIK